jgi:hypothetical protein
MAHCTVDDDRRAFDNLNLGRRGAVLRDLERHDIADHTSITADYNQVVVFLSALYYDIAHDPQNAFGRRSDVESGIASATGHNEPLPGGCSPERNDGK